MDLQIRPIFASLRKHRIPAILIVLEIALACAVLCNAVFMISTRVDDIRLSNAVDSQNISVITLSGADPKFAKGDIPRNLNALRHIPMVQDVAVMNSVPLTRDGWNSNFSTDENAKKTGNYGPNTSQYFMGKGAVNVLGIRLKQGRLFTSEEYADGTLGRSYLPDRHVVVVTQSLAQRLWPAQPALGKKIYAGPYWYIVVGVVADVLRPSLQGDGANAFYYSAFFPLQANENLKHYVIRSASRDRDRIIKAAENTLAKLDMEAVVNGKTLTDIREEYFKNTSVMVWVLVLVCVVMLAVTAFGIFGLTSFWVAQRRHQIGIRRALGATQQEILIYFSSENFLLTSVGIIVGMILAFGINAYLMRSYEMHRMPWIYLPGSAVAMWLLGQLAVVGPALRASRVPPVVATRSA